jgi:hypothetical protein
VHCKVHWQEGNLLTADAIKRGFSCIVLKWTMRGFTLTNHGRC